MLISSRRLGSADLASPLGFPYQHHGLMRTTSDALHKTICDVHEVMLTNTSHTKAWDGVSSILATVFSVSCFSSVQIFLGYPLLLCLFFSAAFDLPFPMLELHQRPDQVFSFICILWEVCMSGI